VTLLGGKLGPVIFGLRAAMELSKLNNRQVHDVARVIWRYRRLAFDVLAELPLPLSLTDAAVDPFPKQVGVAAVAGVLLNHVDQYRAQRRAAAVRLEALDA
jgi:hypothetical protein